MTENNSRVRICPFCEKSCWEEECMAWRLVGVDPRDGSDVFDCIFIWRSKR